MDKINDVASYARKEAVRKAFNIKINKKGYIVISDKNKTPLSCDKIEALAEEIHNIWCGWTKVLMKEEKFSKERVRRWTNECHIPYEKLSEEMKEKDRVIARRILKKLRQTERML